MTTQMTFRGDMLEPMNCKTRVPVSLCRVNAAGCNQTEHPGPETGHSWWACLSDGLTFKPHVRCFETKRTHLILDKARYVRRLIAARLLCNLLSEPFRIASCVTLLSCLNCSYRLKEGNNIAYGVPEPQRLWYLSACFSCSLMQIFSADSVSVIYAVV